MKHTVQITLILLGMFLITQIIGLIVIQAYTPRTIIVAGEEKNVTLPYNLEPPKEMKAEFVPWNIIIPMAFAIFLILLLTRIKAVLFLKLWFFVVVIIALALAINSFLIKIPYSSLLALIVAIPLAVYKIFKRNIIVHNLTELLIYPGIAAVFVPLLSIWAGIVLLVLISAYDIYAVWHSGFMQKMAKFQINHLKIFAGFFVPYLSRKQMQQIRNAKASRGKFKTGKMKISLAILGGGDVVFPLIIAGIVLRSLGFFPALIVSVFSSFGLLYLFLSSEKGKFYPAMPFISAGCFVGLALAYLLF